MENTPENLLPPPEESGVDRLPESNPWMRAEPLSEDEKYDWEVNDTEARIWEMLMSVPDLDNLAENALEDAVAAVRLDYTDTPEGPSAPTNSGFEQTVRGSAGSILADMVKLEKKRRATL